MHLIRLFDSHLTITNSFGRLQLGKRHFEKKTRLARGELAPLTRLSPPSREILDPPLVTYLDELGLRTVHWKYQYLVLPFCHGFGDRVTEVEYHPLVVL